MALLFQLRMKAKALHGAESEGSGESSLCLFRKAIRI